MMVTESPQNSRLKENIEQASKEPPLSPGMGFNAQELHKYLKRAAQGLNSNVATLRAVR